jgi:hypothetical protein
LHESLLLAAHVAAESHNLTAADTVSLQQKLLSQLKENGLAEVSSYGAACPIINH